VAEIMDTLVERSAGVFLWVVLVVKSVIRGLQNGDRLDELTARLDEIPTELLELYQHLLHKVPQEYRAQSSEILQIFMASLPIENKVRQHRLLAIQLAFTQQSETNALDNAVFDPRLEHDPYSTIYQQLEQRIQSRCCGILELSTQPMRHPGLHIKNQLCIEFIHRSAAEFLQNKSVWEVIKAWNPNSDPLKHLFSSCVFLIKALPDPLVPGWAIIYDTMRTALMYAQIAERGGAVIPMDGFDSFDRAMIRHWEALNLHHDGHGQNVGHWSILTLIDTTSRTKAYLSGPTIWDSKVPDLTRRDQSLLISRVAVEKTNSLGFIRTAVLYGLGSYLLSEASVRGSDGVSSSPGKNVSELLLECWGNLIINSTYYSPIDGSQMGNRSTESLPKLPPARQETNTSTLSAKPSSAQYFVRQRAMPIHASFARDAYDILSLLLDKITFHVGYAPLLWDIAAVELLCVRNDPGWDNLTLCEELKKNITSFYHKLDIITPQDTTSDSRPWLWRKLLPDRMLLSGHTLQGQFHGHIKSMLSPVKWSTQGAFQDVPWNENLYRCLQEVSLHIKQHHKANHGRIESFLFLKTVTALEELRVPGNSLPRRLPKGGFWLGPLWL